MKFFRRLASTILCIYIFLSCMAGCRQASQDTSASSGADNGALAEPDIDYFIEPLTIQGGIGIVDMDDVPSLPDVTQEDSTKKMLRFMLTAEDNPHLPYTTVCHISNGQISALLPSGIDLSSLIVDYSFCGEQVYIGDEPLISGETPVDFRQPVPLRMTARDGSEETIVVNIQTLETGLPSLAITTENGQDIVDKETKVPCTFYLGGGDEAVAFYASDTSLLLNATIKGRGNTSWSMEKKSWNVTLAEKQELLDMPASKKWCLIANYQDKSLLRNYMASELAGLMGMEVVMSGRPVDLWYNGRYWGNYLLMEKIEVEKSRINITKFDDFLSSSEIGYHCEVDGHVSEIIDGVQLQNRAGANYNPVTDELWFQTSRYGIYIAIVDPAPDEIREEDIRYIMDFYQGMEDAFASRDIDLISQYIDLPSFVDWFLIEETFKNCDSGLWSSCHMYKDAEGKMHMGPVWDFDMSVGNCNYGGLEDPNGDYVSTSSWFKELLSVPAFAEAVKARWEEIRPLYLDTLPERLDEAAAMIDKSQALNFKRWNILDRQVASNPQQIVAANTYEKQIDFFKAFWNIRIQYLDRVIVQY